MAAVATLKSLARRMFSRPTAGPRTQPSTRLGFEQFEDRVVPAQFFGAIYTSVADGGTVNANVFSSKEDVYLNGGPQNQNAQGLPDGTYFYQVTDPSGSTLLSTDSPWSRQLKVVGGVVLGVPTDPAVTKNFPQHPEGSVNPANGSKPVQLMPYLDTPNNGGEYKVWLIRQTATTTVVDNPTTPEVESLVINFRSNDSKTDNFKVRANQTETRTITISGYKFYDQNTNGTWETVPSAGELPVNDFQFNLYRESGLAPGLQKDGPNADLFVQSTTTGNYGDAGKYTFTLTEDLPGVASTYYVAEVVSLEWQALGVNWVQTTTFGQNTHATIPVPGGNSNASSDGWNFGNVVLGGGNGRTLGFWSNRNGQALVGGEDLAMLTAMHLRNANGSPFDPTTYASFRTWLLGGTATNMAYMLSVQMAAASLNVFNGLVDGNSLVQVADPSTALGYRFVSMNSLIGEANTLLASTGSILSGDAQRGYAERLKNALDAANNNLNYVQIAWDLDNDDPAGVIDLNDFM